jgi:four helix bundle protein
MRRACHAGMSARKLRELDTWCLCDELMRKISAATPAGPASRDFRFRDQINDAAADAASDVAEGFARFYPGEFARFLDYAISSLEEVRIRVGVRAEIL